MSQGTPTHDIIEQSEAALAHLERLQEQLDGLRSVISLLVAPLTRQSTSKAQTFASIRKVTLQTTMDLKAFRDVWTGEQTQEVLVKAGESLARDDDLSKGREEAHYGWTEK